MPALRLETQHWIWLQFLGKWLAGPSVSKKHAGLWKLSAGCCPSFLETGWLAQEVRFPTLTLTYCSILHCVRFELSDYHRVEVR